MPIYEFECVDCGYRGQRVAGIHDHTVICSECGGIMGRLDLDWFASEFMALEQDNKPVRIENVN